MSRSGYTDDFGCDDNWVMIRYRGAVAAAFRGKRGQAFLKEMLAALDTVADGKLIEGALEEDGAVCALGAVGKARGLNMEQIDAGEPDEVAEAFGIAKALAAQIAFYNDELGHPNETPERRFHRVREWIEGQIKQEARHVRG
jgi:hypothetical protein